MKTKNQKKPVMQASQSNSDQKKKAGDEFCELSEQKVPTKKDQIKRSSVRRIQERHA